MKKVKFKNGSEIEFSDKPPKDSMRSPRETCPKTMTGKHHWVLGMFDAYNECHFCGIVDDRE